MSRHGQPEPRCHSPSAIHFDFLQQYGHADLSTGLPGVIPGMGEGRHVAIADIFFWAPQRTSSLSDRLSDI